MSSLRDQVNDLLTKYSDLVHDYFRSLATVAESSSLADSDAPESIAKQMVLVDQQLQLAIEQIEKHQYRQQKIVRVQESIQQHHVALLAIVNKLNDARQDLNESLEKATLDLKAAKLASQSNMQFTDVLSYASKLSKYTSAPPNFDLLNRDVKVVFEKPYPDEDRMRRGLLHRQDTAFAASEENLDGAANEDRHDGDRGGAAEAMEQPEDTQSDQPWTLDLNPELSF